MSQTTTQKRFTKDQQKAIYDGGENLLISASAGSGKTTVLVERVIQKIKAGINIDELLIVTYTEAAAKEMKQRIQVEVQEAINTEEDLIKKQHLIHQLTLLPTAHISTLHAFCLQVIRKYYYLIDIDPVFRLLTDETEMLLLKEDVWEETREELYGERKTSFYQLTENFSNDRNDQGLTDLVYSLYDFAKANPEPEVWLDSLAEVYNIDSSLKESDLYQQFMRPDIRQTVEQALINVEKVIKMVEGEPDFDKTLEVLLSDKALITSLYQSIGDDRLDEFYQTLTTGKFVTIKGPKKNKVPEEVMELYGQVKELRDTQVKKIITDIKKTHFNQSPEVLVSHIQQSQAMVKEMILVEKAFIHAYMKEKQRKNVVDFNDLEHFTLNILRQKGDNGFEASEASHYYRGKFKEVLVDEYQDINQLQENIIYWLRDTTIDKGNLFMVGDVKQSIYAFRLADPNLFIEKYENYEQHKDGRCIVLAQNFRSRGSVLDFTNLVFRQLMNKELGQIVYNKDAELIVGATNFPDSQEHDTELLLFETASDESPEEAEIEGVTFEVDSKSEGEILMVARKIQEMIATGFPIFDKKKQENRPLTYQDIVLLTPTKKHNLVILDTFKELGIPLQVNDTQNYFQATEVKIMVSLLQMIDNPYQDIPMASVLRSPIVGIKENDMVLIRQYDPKGYYFDALEVYLKEETRRTDLYIKIEAFYQAFNGWRELSRREKLMTLIWQIYEDTGFLDYVGGLPSGAQRQANLHALYERATMYEEMSFKGLFQFIRLIEKMQGKNKDLAEPLVAAEEDAVRVMTIHASKGLEFPVVFVMDMSKQFNLTDINNQSYIFDETLGVGIKYFDATNRSKHRTVPFNILREQKRRKILAEEMRKLYVALTRAEEKLFLVGSYKNKEAALKQWSQHVTSENMVLSVTARLSQKSLMDWVGQTLIRHPKLMAQYPEIQCDPLRGLETAPGDFKVTFYQMEDILVGPGGEEDTATRLIESPDTPNPGLLKDIVDRLNFAYPHHLSTMTTSYQSVSEIKSVFAEPDTNELKIIDLSREKETELGLKWTNNDLATPAFLEKTKEVKGADIGTATHLLMQLLSLEKKPTRESVTELLEELVANKVIEAPVAKRVSIPNILTFFSSDFGAFIIENQEHVVREQPFSLLLKASDIFADFDGGEKDTVLVHGIIDGFVETETELILYDFKTDYLSSQPSQEEIRQLVTKYKGQLNLYKQALEQVKGKKVTGVKLVFLQKNIQEEVLYLL